MRSCSPRSGYGSDNTSTLSTIRAKYSQSDIEAVTRDFKRQKANGSYPPPVQGAPGTKAKAKALKSTKRAWMEAQQQERKLYGEGGHTSTGYAEDESDDELTREVMRLRALTEADLAEEATMGSGDGDALTAEISTRARNTDVAWDEESSLAGAREEDDDDDDEPGGVALNDL